MIKFGNSDQANNHTIEVAPRSDLSAKEKFAHRYIYKYQGVKNHFGDSSCVCEIVILHGMRNKPSHRRKGPFHTK